MFPNIFIKKKKKTNNHEKSSIPTFLQSFFSPSTRSILDVFSELIFLKPCFGSGRRSWRGNGTGTRRGDGEGFRNGYRREVRRSPTRFPLRIGWIRSRTRTRTTIALWRSWLQSYVIPHTFKARYPFSTTNELLQLLQHIPIILSSEAEK